MDRKIDILRLHIWVSGRVQNVGFRAFVQQTGAELGLTGWVRNVGYDSVETVAEGAREVLERFSLAVQNGPRGSRVDESRVDWEAASAEFKSFGVRNSIWSN